MGDASRADTRAQATPRHGAEDAIDGRADHLLWHVMALDPHRLLDTADHPPAAPKGRSARTTRRSSLNFVAEVTRGAAACGSMLAMRAMVALILRLGKADRASHSDGSRFRFSPRRPVHGLHEAPRSTLARRPTGEPIPTELLAGGVPDERDLQQRQQRAALRRAVDLIPLCSKNGLAFCFENTRISP